MLIGRRFKLRWFTPRNEAHLCGHGTLASAAVLFQCYGNQNKELEFETCGGLLSAESNDGLVNLHLPLPKITDQVNGSVLLKTTSKL